MTHWVLRNPVRRDPGQCSHTRVLFHPKSYHCLDCGEDVKDSEEKKQETLDLTPEGTEPRMLTFSRRKSIRSYSPYNGINGQQN